MPPIPHYWNISFIMLSLKCEQRSSKLPVLLSTLKPKLGHSFPYANYVSYFQK